MKNPQIFIGSQFITNNGVMHKVVGAEYRDGVWYYYSKPIDLTDSIGSGVTQTPEDEIKYFSNDGQTWIPANISPRVRVA